MYQDIINGIDNTIEIHKKIKFKTDGMTDKEKHYFIQGLEVAKQVVTASEEFAVNETPYETFEDVVRSLKDNLERFDMEVIIEDIFMDEDE